MTGCVTVEHEAVQQQYLFVELWAFTSIYILILSKLREWYSRERNLWPILQGSSGTLLFLMSIVACYKCDLEM